MSPIENVKPTSVPGRRSFLRNTIAGLASVILLAFAGPAAGYLFAKRGGPSSKIWVDAGDISEVSRKQPQEITFESSQTDGWNTERGKSSAWIVRGKDESVTAFSPWCTHLGCAYHWEPRSGQKAGGCFVCPCHGSTFDANGKVLQGPALRPLDRYQTKMQRNRLWVLPSTDESAT